MSVKEFVLLIRMCVLRIVYLYVRQRIRIGCVHVCYGVATMSRLLEITGLFCRILSVL
jgi:hypothetical protein